MSGYHEVGDLAGAFKRQADEPRPHRRRSAPPFSIRLTPEERSRLDALAGGQPLGAYIRGRLLGEGAEVRRTQRRPTADDAKIAMVLAELGKSHLASNINQLAKAANTGRLDVSPGVVRDLEQACREIAAMRALLIAALGIKPEDGG